MSLYQACEIVHSIILWQPVHGIMWTPMLNCEFMILSYASTNVSRLKIQQRRIIDDQCDAFSELVKLEIQCHNALWVRQHVSATLWILWILEYMHVVIRLAFKSTSRWIWMFLWIKYRFDKFIFIHNPNFQTIWHAKANIYCVIFLRTAKLTHQLSMSITHSLKHWWLIFPVWHPEYSGQTRKNTMSAYAPAPGTIK